jgi:hypothetical protein
MFCCASLTVALEPSRCPTCRFARARSGIDGAVKAARPTPIQLASGRSPVGEVRLASTAT